MTKVSKNTIEIRNLKASIEGKNILNGINLDIKSGKVITLMGPNGSGKSTLSHVLMGNPNYQVNGGKITWQNKNLLKLEAHQRSQMGLFLAFQYPMEVPGVNMFEFLLTTDKIRFGKKSNQNDFKTRLDKAMKQLNLPESFLERSLNEGFSGGEKKKAEILQLMLFKPKIAILDETDSGLDIDALKLIAKSIRIMAKEKTGFLIITHYKRLLTQVKPDEVHVMHQGKIVKSGSGNLVNKLEKEGYDWLKK